jgi:5-methyltetrahydropteroyltriglutamate--homocysteine methyltransferase
MKLPAHGARGQAGKSIQVKPTRSTTGDLPPRAAGRRTPAAGAYNRRQERAAGAPAHARPPMTRILQTTIAGSLPKPAWLCPPRQLWAPWLLEGEALAEGKRDAVRLVLRDQEHAGLDIVTDGEQTRRHFVTTFIEGLDGVDFEHRRTVRIRNRYDADVPVVVGPVARRGGVFVEDARFLRSATERRVKFTLPGPMTMVDTLYDDHYGSREKLAWAFAEILNEEALAIAATGVDVIQFDEPAFNVYFDEVRDWGIAALERAAAGLPCTTAVHICYGYGIKANIEWKKTLGSEWRQYEETFPRLAASKIDQVSLECANSRVPIDLIGLLGDKDVLVGAIDVASEKIETPEEVAATIRAALAFVKPERLYPCTNCGMVPLPREVARGKLAALGAGAALVRHELD